MCQLVADDLEVNVQQRHDGTVDEIPATADISGNPVRSCRALKEYPSRQPMNNGSTSTPPTPAAGSPMQPLRFRKMQSKEADVGNGLALPSPMFTETTTQAPSVLAPPAHIASSSVSSTVSSNATLVEPSAQTLTPTSPTTEVPHNHASTRAPSASTSTYTSLPIHSSPPPISAPLPAVLDVPRPVAPVVRSLPPTPPTESPAVTPPILTPSTPRKSLPASLDMPTPIARHDYNPTPPDTSTSSAFDTSTSTAFARVFSDPGSDEEVGIGLTLLQDLADGGASGAWGDLDEDSDDDEELERIRREGRQGLEREANEVENRGLESLGRNPGPAEAKSMGCARSPKELTFPPVSPRGISGGQYEFPAPPTHMHTYSLTQENIQDLSGPEHERERRPSPVPSAGSTSDWEGASDIYDDYRYSRFSMGGASVASGSGSKISRMSVASGKSVGGRSLGGTSAKSSLGARRTSVGSSKAGPVGTGDYPVFVDNPEAKSRVDSGTSHGGSRPSGDGCGRPSVESLLRTRVAAAGSGHTVPSITEHDIPAGDGARNSQEQTQNAGLPNVKSRRHTRGESLLVGGSESDGSVYTQESIGGGGSVRTSVLPPSSRLAPNVSQPPTSTSTTTLPLPVSSTSTSTSSSARNSGGNLASASGNRPAPLNLVASGPTNHTNGPLSPPPSSQDANFQLLHTTWASPMPSPGQDSTTFSSTGYTGTNDGFTGRGYATPANAAHFPGVASLDAVSRALGGGGDSSGGGAASALRQHIEVDRRPSPMPTTPNEHPKDGSGRRIVIEDNDEPVKPQPHSPSAPSSPVEPKGNFKTVIHQSPSPDPDLISRGRLHR